MNAFDVMMKRSESSPNEDKDTIVTAVIYRRWVEKTNHCDPLWRTPYIGQAVRLGTPSEVAKARWKEEDHDAFSQNKDVGLLAVLKKFGPDAMENVVLDHMTGPRSVVQPWANEAEVKTIQNHGGLLRDMNRKLNQTLNISPGGKNGKWWANNLAFRQNRFEEFKAEVEEFVNLFNTSRVPKEYVNPNNGYALGHRMGHFRSGVCRFGMPNQEDIELWAESLPDWTWNMNDSSFEDFKSQMERYCNKHGTSLVPQKYVDPETGIALGLKLHDFKRNTIRSQNQKQIQWAESLPDWSWNATTTESYKSSLSSSVSRWWKNASLEEKKMRADKQSIAAKAKQVKRLSSMTDVQKAAEMKTIESNKRAIARTKEDLELLRKIMPNAKRKDVPKARRDGLIPSRRSRK